MKVWVILWTYGDKSGFGAVRAYLEKSRADADLSMLREYCDTRSFVLAEFDADAPRPEQEEREHD